MKVLQVIPTLGTGGAQGFLTNLGVSLANFGVDVKFYVLGGVRGERGKVLHQRLVEAGVEVQGLKERHPASASNWFTVARLLRTWNPDIVQANLYSTEVVCAAAKYVGFCRKSQYFRRLANTDLVAYRSPFVVRLMDRVFPDVVACSPAVADAYRAFMGAGQRARLTTIPNGGLLMDAPPSPQDKQQARASLGIPGDAYTIAHIGRMFGGGETRQGRLESSQKAHDVLIRAFAQLLSSTPDSVLLLVGDGQLRPDVEALADELGVADKTRFLGQVPEPWPALLAADVFFFPSRFEGLPNVLPEAASAGLPVVASEIPEIRDLTPGPPWLLEAVDDVEAFAAALKCVHDELPAFTRLAQEATPAIRQRFSMQTCARKYVKAYENALGSESSL